MMVLPKLLFENERVRVSDVRLSPGESIQTTLGFPTVRWQVDDGWHKGGPDDDDDNGPVQVHDKQVIFDESGSICEIENAGQEIYRQVWFEIKREPSRTEEQVQKALSEAIYTTDVGTQLLLENRWCRVWDFYLEPGEGDPHEPHHHVLDYVFVYVAKGRLLGYSHNGEPGLFDSVNNDGDVTWFDIPPGAENDVHHAHAGKNGYDDLPMREYLVELK
eukprot:CAMPEP_0168742900 /NCGR_PEP_ID=MMETSP0724-20121128/13281_1 /TAXON_ID=265536 /ORGANISM="Amphiprora sp., Strain CCMP467" /LENGTH=217 /DNA_ID=CAMNT_0008790477 /DNA_START=63 /DNA_END=716 /DNA_ORIENTATION=-